MQMLNLLEPLKIVKVIATHFLLCVHLYIIAHFLITITKLIRLGKKQPNKTRPLLIFEHKEDKVMVLSQSHQLPNEDAY